MPAKCWCCAKSRTSPTSRSPPCSICRSAPSCPAWVGRARNWPRPWAAAWEGGIMDCRTCEAMVDAYVDGELSVGESVAFENALEACPECRRRFQSARTISAMMRELPVEPAPDLLRARLERELRDAPAPARPAALRRWRVAAMVASLLLALGIGG